MFDVRTSYWTHYWLQKISHLLVFVSVSLESFFTAVSCKKLLMETENFFWNLIKRYVHIPQNAIIPIFLFISNHICLVFSLPLIFASIKVVPNKKGPGSGTLPHFHPRTTFYSVQFTYFCKQFKHLILPTSRRTLLVLLELTLDLEFA